MTTKKDYSLYRSDLFRHLDGIVTAPAAYALHSKGVTAYLLEHQRAARFLNLRQPLTQMKVILMLLYECCVHRDG